MALDAQRNTIDPKYHLWRNLDHTADTGSIAHWLSTALVKALSKLVERKEKIIYRVCLLIFISFKLVAPVLSTVLFLSQHQLFLTNDTGRQLNWIEMKLMWGTEMW